MRLSVFDRLPSSGPDRTGIPSRPRCPTTRALARRVESVAKRSRRTDRRRSTVERLGVTLLNVTAGSPYRASRAAARAFPRATATCRPRIHWSASCVCSMRRAVRTPCRHGRRRRDGPTCRSSWRPWRWRDSRGLCDAVGLGAWRSAARAARRRSRRSRARAGRICRSFSDCTTAPRSGLVSGCYPLDPFYRERPEHALLDARKRELADGRRRDLADGRKTRPCGRERKGTA